MTTFKPKPSVSSDNHSYKYLRGALSMQMSAARSVHRPADNVVELEFARRFGPGSHQKIKDKLKAINNLPEQDKEKIIEDIARDIMIDIFSVVAVYYMKSYLSPSRFDEAIKDERYFDETIMDIMNFLKYTKPELIMNLYKDIKTSIISQHDQLTEPETFIRFMRLRISEILNHLLQGIKP